MKERERESSITKQEVYTRILFTDIKSDAPYSL